MKFLNLVELKAAIEVCIDKHGLPAILETINSICDEKALHIEENSNDKQLIKKWEKAGIAIMKANNKIQLLEL